MRKKRRRIVLLILLLSFIWGNSMLSREASGAISGALLEKMNTLAQGIGLGEDFFSFMIDKDGDGVDEADDYYIRKAAHVTEFAALSALLRLIFEEKRRPGIRAFSAAVLCAAADETIQIFSHRGSQLRDVCIDAAGAALGLGLTRLIAAVKEKRAARS